ncbi:hypothetical protein HNY73_011315 [Argiope bruennichi]|uniref:Uncharacterized protein n=1 Tax=Argiope bruennichi TaxID=94029 RepID=A0A8T0F4P1_ARGBR|nr:hypothetical protein HNY73_011315 [Argiope bruennichi]
MFLEKNCLHLTPLARNFSSSTNTSYPKIAPASLHLETPLASLFSWRVFCSYTTDAFTKRLAPSWRSSSDFSFHRVRDWSPPRSWD